MQYVIIPSDRCGDCSATCIGPVLRAPAATVDFRLTAAPPPIRECVLTLAEVKHERRRRYWEPKMVRQLRR